MSDLNVEIQVPEGYVLPYGPQREGVRQVPLEDLDGATGFVAVDCGKSSVVYVQSIGEYVFVPTAWLA